MFSNDFKFKMIFIFRVVSIIIWIILSNQHNDGSVDHKCSIGVWFLPLNLIILIIIFSPFKNSFIRWSIGFNVFISTIHFDANHWNAFRCLWPSSIIFHLFNGDIIIIFFLVNFYQSFWHFCIVSYYKWFEQRKC